MNTTLRKVTKVPAKSSVIIVSSGLTASNAKFFSGDELTYVKNEIKKKTKIITVDQYSRQVILQIVDTKNANKPSGYEKHRRSGASLMQILNGKGVKDVTVISDADMESTVTVIEGMLLSNYQFLKYKSKPAKNSITAINVISNSVTAKILSELGNVCDAVCNARDLVNEPLISLSATELANRYKKLGRKGGFKVTVFNKSRIKALKMGGLLAVNAGSIDPPTFTIMEWKPSRPVNKNPIVLVGKGVVYDTGGLSLKPTGNSMDYMKSDMAGAAVVGSAVYAVAKEKLPVHVIALVPATDNRPDGNAYTPGDVIKMMSGMTVEVLNTDAEGRMILADALHYAKRYKPELVMEFSTLTGAAANAIGHYGIVCMGNCDEKVKKQLSVSGDRVYERLVEFPFWEEYDELLKSDIADIKNIGGPVGGAITAGRFLQNFTDYPYMHFDIAGPSFIKSNDSYRGKNGSGVGVRLIYDFLRTKAGR